MQKEQRYIVRFLIHKTDMICSFKTEEEALKAAKFHLRPKVKEVTIFDSEVKKYKIVWDRDNDDIKVESL